MKTALGIGLALLGAVSAYAAPANDSLIEAVRLNDHAAIKSLLARHANPNQRLADKSTVLSWAVDRQDQETVQMLLAAGAKPNVVDVSGATPLLIACELDDSVIVTDLLKSGADAKATRPDGISALALCAGTATPDVLETMIAKGADVNHADPLGQTPLMRAAAAGKTPSIAVLIKHGANVNAATKTGFTPLFFALKSKEPSAPEALLAAGADAGALLSDKTSVAQAALIEGDDPFAIELVKHGADLTHRDAEGRQLIHIAAASGDGELVKLVLEKGGDANAPSTPPPAPPKQTFEQIIAANKGKIAKADGSTVPPADVPLPTPPLIYAAKAGSLEAMKALVQAGAKPDAKTSDGTTLALAAAYGGNPDAMKYALELDPDLTATTDAGNSLMHMAVMNRAANEQDREQMIVWLVDKGAKLDIKNKRRATPGDYLNSGQESPELRIFFIDLLKQHNIVSTNH